MKKSKTKKSQIKIVNKRSIILIALALVIVVAYAHLKNSDILNNYDKEATFENLEFVVPKDFKLEEPVDMSKAAKEYGLEGLDFSIPTNEWGPEHSVKYNSEKYYCDFEIRSYNYKRTLKEASSVLHDQIEYMYSYLDYYLYENSYAIEERDDWEIQGTRLHFVREEIGPSTWYYYYDKKSDDHYLFYFQGKGENVYNYAITFNDYNKDDMRRAAACDKAFKTFKNSLRINRVGN